MTPSTSSSWDLAPRVDGLPSASPRRGCAWPCSRRAGSSPTPTTRSTCPRTGCRIARRSKRPLERERPVQSGSYAVREWNADWFVNDIDEPYVDKSDPRSCGCARGWWEVARTSGAATACGSATSTSRRRPTTAPAWTGRSATPTSRRTTISSRTTSASTGLIEGLAELPDGRFQPAMPFTCAETALRTRFKQKFGRTLTQGRSANLTRPHPRTRSRATTAARASTAA